MSSVGPQFDLAIIGAGPAGSSAAITAARAGASVVLCEARTFPRHKVCGEFVSAEALDVLAGLLRDVPGTRSLFERAPVIDRTRLFFGWRAIKAPVAPAALSIARFDLDARLWAAAQLAGVTAFADCEVSAVQGDGPFCLQTAQGAITARALLIAAGRWSAFTPNRQVSPGPKWIGVKAHFRETRPQRSSDLYFFEGGYCGVQPMSDDVVNACAMVRSDRATSLADVFQLNPLLLRRASNWTPATRAVSTAPLIHRQAQPIRGNILNLGDAAAFIDPFVGDGISIALRSGRVAAQCVSRFLTGEMQLSHAAKNYQAEYERQFAPLLAAAARMRSLFLLPAFAKTAVFEMLRFPGLITMVIRKTRRAG